MERTYRFAGRIAFLVLWVLFVMILSGGTSAMAESERQFLAEIAVNPFAQGPATVNMLIPEGVNSRDPDLRFYPFDTETGLYTTGNGEPAGDRAEVTVPEGQDRVLIVSLKETGKYSLYGIPFYVLSPETEALNQLAEEIREAVDKAEGKDQKATAEKLYTWLLKRVKSVIPDDREELQEACTDPFNCLLTGYALPETYGPLYQLLLRCADIRSIPVYGTARETDHSWVMCRLDGQWLYADPAMDDVKDRAEKKYFALAGEKMEKDHTLSAPSETLVKERVTGTALDAFLAGDYEILDLLLRQGEGASMSRIEGKYYGFCPTEPVTIQRYSTYEGPLDLEPEFYARGALGFYLPWDSELHRFLLSDGTVKNIPKNAFEVLDHTPDYSTITIRFLIPGAYYLNGQDEYFFALDPDDEAQAAAAALLDEALETCRRDTEKETAKALHDWEAKRLSYDNESYRHQRQDGFPGYDDCAQCPIASLLRGKAVCGGYAHLYNLLLNSAGIHSYFVVGWNTERARFEHAWNLCRLDGEWSYTDVTWDDQKGEKYFAKSYETFLKDHMPSESWQVFSDTWARNRIYDQQLFRFFRDWGPKNTLPKALLPIPATFRQCGFPATHPDFYKIRLTYEDGYYFLQNTGRNVTCYRLLEMNERGKKPDSTGGYNFEGIIKFPHQFILDFTRPQPKYLRLILQDYQEEMRPANRPSYYQMVEWINGETAIEYAEFHYQVPMKKNEIKGFGDGSFRSFIYDQDLQPTACSWHLVSELETLDLTLYFDEEGNTTRYRVSRTPTGMDKITWEAEPDGTITYLGYMKDGTFWNLDDVTDVYPLGLYHSLRNNIQIRYDGLITDDNPPEEGVRLYALRKNDEEIYAAFRAYAVRDSLFRWNERGQLEFNPDAVDIVGKTIDLDGFSPDLSVCERLEINPQE